VKPVLFTAAAEADVEEAFQWYEAQRPGLGAAFRQALDVGVASVENGPEAYAVVHRNTRRALLPKFLVRSLLVPERVERVNVSQTNDRVGQKTS
jgi:plasmid stabilization system protein ParE